MERELSNTFEGEAEIQHELETHQGRNSCLGQRGVRRRHPWPFRVGRSVLTGMTNTREMLFG